MSSSAETKSDEGAAAATSSTGAVPRGAGRSGNKRPLPSSVVEVHPQWKKRRARDVSVYNLLEPLGEGQYGKVWKAQEPTTGQIVALKMIKTDQDPAQRNDGFPITSVREIRILKSLNHRNIVKLLEVVMDKNGTVEGGKPGDVYMVFEYLEYDLSAIISSRNEGLGVAISAQHIKCYMMQLLEGVASMHSDKMMHRDLKGANLLVNAKGELKIGDLGLARSFYEGVATKTRTVITLWYRPPELLLRTTNYGPEVDMWSVGCIFAEMKEGRAILRGNNEMEQLDLIFSLCGSPTTSTWPGVDKLPDWPKYSEKILQSPKESQIEKRFEMWDPKMRDLLGKLLTLNPKTRISANQALDHDYFWTEPRAGRPEDLPSLCLAPCHEYDLKKRRAAKDEEERKRREEEQQRRTERRREGQPPAAGGGDFRGGQYGGRGEGGAGKAASTGKTSNVKSKGW